MSPQPSRIGKVPPEASVGRDDLIFGEEARFSLMFPRTLIAQLWAQVNEGTRILTRGGLEVGGLLVGPRVYGGAVVVDAIVPLPIEYRHGPSFQMSSADLEGIAPAIDTIQQDRSKAVVGFYRGRTRGEPALRESDLEILDVIEQAHASFAADFRCFFVLAPASEAMALACITMREGIGWRDVQPFTLRSNPLSIVGHPPSTALQRAPRNPHTEEAPMHAPVAPSVRPAAEYEYRSPEPRALEHRALERPLLERTSLEQRGLEHPPFENRPLEHRFPEDDVVPSAANSFGIPRERMWLYSAAALIAIALAGGAIRWATKKQPPPAPILRTETEPLRPHLGFSATREGPVWKLSWDRAVMDALTPVGAVLSIQDGGFLQQVPLAPPDLASGTLFYTPQSNDLTFGLRIDRGGSHVEEQVRVLEAARSQKPFDRTAPVVTGRAPVQAPVANSSPSSNAATAAPTQPTPPRREFTPPTTNRVASSVSPPVPPPQVASLAVPVPPSIQPRANGGVAFLPAPVAQNAAAPPPAPTAVAPVSNPAPVPSVPAPASSTVAGAVTSSVNPNYVAPRPIQQVRPQTPSGIPAGASQVQVLVEIDAQGKVTKATPVGGTATNAPLMIAAVRAASAWVFAPARLNGRPIASQMNLFFRF